MYFNHIKMNSKIFFCLVILISQSISLNLNKVLKSKSPSFDGKYAFRSQSMFNDYLISNNVGLILRKVINKSKPDISISTNGQYYEISFITSLKTFRITFDLNNEFEADLGFDQIKRYRAELISPNTIQLKVIDSPVLDLVKFTFSDDKLVISYEHNNVISERIFKRA